MIKRFLGVLIAIIIILVFIIFTKKRRWCTKISENYALDFQILTKIREYKDGISLEPFSIQWDKYIGDHNPKLCISSVMFNYCIFELDIYNIHHAEKKDN